MKIELLRERYKLNLNIPGKSQVTFSTKNLKLFRPKIWKAQPVNIRTVENFNP